jgi:hypothetical protein
MDILQHEEVVKKYIQAYNNFDISGMLVNLHPDIVFRNIAGGVVNLITNGIAEFENQAKQAEKIFSEREQKIKNITVKGDSVEVLIEYEGLLAVDLPNGLKAGTILKLNGKSVFGFAANKIITLDDIT